MNNNIDYDSVTICKEDFVKQHYLLKICTNNILV